MFTLAVLSRRSHRQSSGHKSFAALAVTTNVPSAISPCGMCRQFIREFCKAEMPILLVPGDYHTRIQGTEGDGISETSIGILLPDSFGPEHLELEREGKD